MSRVPGTYRRPAGPTVYLLPSIPDGLPTTIKNAIAIRNQCATDGVCPGCGTVGELTPDREHENLMYLTFRHEPWCGCLRDREAAA